MWKSERKMNLDEIKMLYFILYFYFNPRVADIVPESNLLKRKDFL